MASAAPPSEKQFPSSWVSYADLANQRPIREERFGVERLKSHARWLGEGMQAPKKSVGRPLPTIFARNAEILRDAHRLISEAYRTGEPLGNDAEWLLDNFHIITDTLAEIRTDLPIGYYHKLPKLADGPLAGYPRVYALALDLTAHSDSSLEETNIVQFVQAFQEASPLTVGEIWAVPIMLRLCLIENLRRLSQQILHFRSHRLHARDWIATNLASFKERPGPCDFEISQRSLEWRDCYVMHLLEGLHDYGAIHPEGVEGLEKMLVAMQDSPAAVLRREKERQAANQVSIGNCVTSLRLLSALDWARFFETTSRLEAILADDPAGVYEGQDFATRDEYRRIIEKLAYHSGTGELAVAQRLIQMAATSPSALNEPRRHIGYYLVDEGLPALESEINYRPPLRDWPSRWVLAHPGFAYFGSVAFLTVVGAGLLTSLVMLLGGSIYGTLAMVGFALVFLTGLAVEISNTLLALLLPPKILPSLEMKSGIPLDASTFIVIPSLLSSEAGVSSLVERLEIHYLSNTERNVYFALLTDFGDAEKEVQPEDEKLLRAAEEGIRLLNEKYTEVDTPFFFLFHRKRQWNPDQQCWMGWERKRGKLAEFNRLLRGDSTTSYVNVDERLRKLPRIRFVITLDADTQLPRESAKRLIALLAHPLNLPKLDSKQRVVAKGYGVLQPRIGFSFPSARRSLFSRLFSGSAGIDPYTTAVSDTYQDLFRSGSFTGKGIYEVDSFETVTGTTFPENQILSHDLIEGNYARCGLVTNVELLDDFPATYSAYLRREHRWIRGDWQILPWLFSRVPESGSATVRNPLGALERWKIFDNLRRSLLAPTMLAWIILGWTLFPHVAWAWTVIAFFVLTSRVFIQMFQLLLGYGRSVLRGRYPEARFRELFSTFGQALVSCAVLPTSAINSLDAIGRTLVRIWITKKRRLEWETAAAVESRLQHTFRAYLVTMWAGPAVAVVVALAFARGDGWVLLAAAPFLLAWGGSPWLAFVMSQTRKRDRAPLNLAEVREIRRLARKTWAFFEVFVGTEDHWLPPDNYQEDPKGEIAHRTSPTNIGLYLLSCVTAHDFGYVSLQTLIERVENTFATLRRMERSHGHFFNWYETQHLQPLHPLYLSTVDSGNFVACLVTLKQSLLEKIDSPILSTAAVRGLEDTWFLLEESLGALPHVSEIPPNKSAEPTDATDPERGQVFAADWVTTNDWEKGLFRVKDLAHRTATHTAATAKDAKNNQEAQRWRNTLVSLLEQRSQELDAIRERLAGDGSSLSIELVTLKTLAAAALPSDPSANGVYRPTPSQWAEECIQRCLKLAAEAEAFAAAMDFTVLFNAQRHLFAVGYNQSTGRLDGSHYDLLASEACLTSFLAIARREAPRKHWFHLGRPVADVAGNRVLISWGGTMFEYLMPRLLLGVESETLLGETQLGAVAAQIEYGKRCGTPWGISESAFITVDGNRNYQYQAFGTPALGLKRGLGKDLVIAPYATGLAFMVEPRQALANLYLLRKEGAEGEFGWYEALDYTAERLPKGQRLGIVKCFMAHHQGMTFVSLANCLLDDPMPRRFRAEAMVRATELLLQERVPVGVPLSESQPAEPIQTTFHEVPTQLSRRLTTPHTALPRTHLLASDQYSVMVTATGSGFSTARGFAVSRWREDSACDVFGHFIYLRDRSSGRTWSAGYMPVAKEPEVYEVTFSADKAEIRRQDGKIETRMEITVSPDDHTEVRRITVANHDDHAHEIELTSYVEVVLLPQATDLAHPAFGKLFLETEYVSESGALLCRRRPRSPESAPVWAVHVMAAEGIPVGPMQFETDRARFLGRGRTPRNPEAMDVGITLLSETVGAVLDPILSLRRIFTVQAGESVKVSFSTGLANSRAEALAFADTRKDPHSVHRAFELAWAHSQVELRQQHVSAADTHLFQRLASHLIFAGKHLRAAPEIVTRNTQGQSDLWRLGISGDLPIVLVRIANVDELPLAKQIVAAHAFWRLKNLAVDLVFLNEEGGSYFEELDQQLQQLVRASEDRARLEKPGGVFIRKSANLSAADMVLLQATARCVLLGSRGLLGVQLERLERVRRAEVTESPHRPNAATTRVDTGRQISTGATHFQNGIGGFGDGGAEYVLHLREKKGQRILPPQPWINVLANPKIGCLVSETGGGFTWCENSQAHRLTPWQNDPVSDRVGEVVYLREENSGDLWSATPAPCGSGADFLVRHGQGYSVFEQVRNDLSCQLTIFIAKEEPIKFYRLTVRNLGTKTRRLSAFYYAELVLGTHRGRNAAHTITEVDSESGALIARNRWDAEFQKKVVFADVNQRPRNYTTNRTEFIGRNGTLGVPRGCEQAELGGSVGACLDPCFALQANMVIPAQEERELIFILGESDDVEEARRLVQIVHESERLEREWKNVVGFWEEFTGRLKIQTPNQALDFLVNRWLPYQVLACRMWGRSALYQSGGAYGFRDQLQDCMALVYARPEETRKHILRAAARQFVEGDVQHWWHVPSGAGVRTRISDDLLWLPFVVHHYVTVTGDEQILNEPVEFLEGPVLRADQEEDYRVPMDLAPAEPLFEHCVRAIRRASEFGVHDLPLMGTGDWNDGMNRVGASGRGESVWLGWFLLTVAKNFADLCERRGEHNLAETFREEARRLGSSIELNAWDGEWYRRAYFDDGTPLGSATNDECRIDSLPQSWSVISGAGNRDRALSAMEAAHEQLVKPEKRLILLFTPPFDQGSLQPGYIKGYVPGIRENGGQYTHAALWVAQAWALLGNGERAVEILDLLNPVLHTDTPAGVERYRLEPYVVAADVYGAPPHEGRGGWSWYTGSAAWYYRVVVETLLGLEVRDQRFRVTPRIPATWATFEITYRFKTATYQIRVERATAATRSLDEEAWSEEWFPFVDDGKVHNVVLQIV